MNLAAAFILLTMLTLYPSAPRATAAVIPDAYVDIVADFALLQGLLSEADPYGIYYKSRIGPTREEASRHLLMGFDAAMVDSILTAYTFTDAAGQLCIIPCDALPYLAIDDWPGVTMRSDGNTLYFTKRFYTCYQPGDCYEYEVAARCQKQTWRIVALSLTEFNAD